MRLNQFLAKHVGISRRRADEVIKEGEVKLNGVIGELHNQVEAGDKVDVLQKGRWRTFDLQSEESKVLLMYKPAMSMTTAHDPEGRRTVFDLLPLEFQGYKTAGRLDFMSEGLLVLSNNGHLILSLTHPKFKSQKEYLVGLKKPLSKAQLELAASGEMELDGYLLNPVQIYLDDLKKYDFLNLDPQLNWYKFELSEGRNRQIRKMIDQFNNNVIRLIRVKHGRFEVTNEIRRKGYILVDSIGNGKTVS